MTFVEALQHVKESNGDLWAHVVGTKGWGYTFKNRDWVVVPTDHGGDPAFVPSPSRLFAEWEAVKPSVILDE